jgi:hypothetical protein
MKVKPEPGSLSVALSAPKGLYAVKLGEIFDVTVKVTATGSDFNDVFLTNGGVVVTPACLAGSQTRKSNGHSVVITYSPPAASGFPLHNGSSRTFEFKARGHNGGPAILSVTARGATASGETIRASDSSVVDVEYPLPQNGGEQPEQIAAHVCGTRPQNPPPPGGSP